MSAGKRKIKVKRAEEASAQATEEAVEPASSTPDQQDVPTDQEGAEASEAAEVEQVDELTQARREAEEWKDKFLRAKAEQQNALRRAQNEREEVIRYANTQLLRSLLDVCDDFQRTIEAAATGESTEAVIDGVKLVRDKLEKVLTDNFVVQIEAVGGPFDPTRHEAIMQQPSADHEPQTVIQEVQKGYMLRDRVLRPAKVIVSSAPAGEQEARA